MRKRTMFVFLLVLGVALVACTAEPEVVEVTRVVTETETVVQEGETVEVEVTRVITEEVVEEVTRVVTEEVEVVVEATPVPVERNGAWIDTLVVVEEPNQDAGVTRLEAGDIDIYAYTISSPEVYNRIQASEEDLITTQSYGSYNELTFNPAEFADGRFNPFTNRKIREAMNWLIDREHITQEIMGGLGVPRYVPINGASADRGKLAGEIRAIEAKYAYDPERATAIITEEMEAMGASLEDGTWMFNGEPIEIIVLIRVEDERQQIGDYVSNQLEDIGFTVTRDYKTSAEASTCWVQSDPTDGCMHIYTGGWISTAISRDQGTMFQDFYTPAGFGIPLWQAYTPDPEFAALAQRLNDNDFTTLDERIELFRQLLPMALEDSVRMWLLDRVSITPRLGDVSVAADLSGNVYGANIWPATLRRTGEVGGSMTWAMPSILTEPWNPVDGTNWIYDMSLIRAVSDMAHYNDPNTGLNLPNRPERGEIFVQEGLPVGNTYDWVSVEFVSENVVPDDAWVDWDAANQVWITAGETEEAETAILKAVAYYPEDLFDTVKWHDGSPFSLGDMVMFAIMTFDRAKEESAIYDAAYVPEFESFLTSFKGWRIASEDPVVIEYYTDQWALDAEESWGTFGNTGSMWPYWSQGESPWHVMNLGALLDGSGLATFGSAKSDELEVEWQSWISGPVVEMMATQLNGDPETGEPGAAETGNLPYAPTMSQFVSEEEVATRYANLQTWYERRGHFWVGTGPFFLQRAFPVEGTVILERFPDYPDSANKWDRFSVAPIAELEVDGPGRVTVGEEATFDIFVTFQGEPYATADIEELKYLVFDATGELAESGVAEAVEDGLYQVTLSADLTGGLETGSNRLEVVVVSRRVALPSLGEFPFVTAP